MRQRAIALALFLGQFPVHGAPALAQDLTSAQERILDGAFLYLSAPDYCDPAPGAAALRSWIDQSLRENAISLDEAAVYLRENLDRLRMIADAAFTGRRRQELCDSIRAQVSARPVPER